MSFLVNFAYGANLSPSCLTVRRGIHPVSSRRAKLLGWTFDFTLRGIPVLEPAFGNVIPCIHTWQKIIERRKRAQNQASTRKEVCWNEWGFKDFLSELSVVSSENALNCECDCYVEGMCYELDVEDFHRLMRYEGSSLSPEKRNDFGYLPLLVTLNAEKNQCTKDDGQIVKGDKQNHSAAEVDWLDEELESVNGYVLIAPAHWNNFYDAQACYKNQLNNSSSWQNRSCACHPHSTMHVSATSVENVHSAEFGDISSSFSPVPLSLLQQRCPRWLPSQRYVSLLQNGAKHFQFSKRYQQDIEAIKQLALKKSAASTIGFFALFLLTLLYFCVLSPLLLWQATQRSSIRLYPFTFTTSSSIRISMFRLFTSCAWSVSDFFQQIITVHTPFACKYEDIHAAPGTAHSPSVYAAPVTPAANNDDADAS